MYVIKFRYTGLEAKYRSDRSFTIKRYVVSQSCFCVSCLFWGQKSRIRNQMPATPDKERKAWRYLKWTSLSQILLMTPTSHPQKITHGRGDKIMVGTVVKAKVGELGEYIREVYLRSLMKDRLEYFCNDTFHAYGWS